MKTIHLTVGPSGSGKTTWAREWVSEDPANRVRINRDDIRQMIQGKAYLDSEGEKIVTFIQQGAAHHIILNSNKDIIIDDTNLNPYVRQKWAKLAEWWGATIVYHDQFLKVDMMTYIINDLGRVGEVGRDVIKSQFDKYINTGKATVS